MKTNNTKIPALRFPEFEGGWEEKRLGEIAKFSKGKNISKADIEPDGMTECIRYGELYTTYGEIIDKIVSRTNLSIDELVFSNADDVIIPASGEASIDIATASCVTKENIALGGDLNIIRSSLNGKFLAYNLNNKQKYRIAALAQGNSVVHLYPIHLEVLLIAFPTLPEQQKIADYLSVVDKRLQSLKGKKTKLEEYKRGVMQRIFSQKLRFTRPDGSAYPDWMEKRLADILLEHKSRNSKLEVDEVFSVAKEKGVINQIEHLGRSYAADDTSNYKVVYPFDIIYTKSPTSGFPFGIIKQNKTDRIGIVSTLYGVFRPNNEYIGYYLDAYFSSEIRTYNYLVPLVQKGAKNTMNINNDTFLDGANISLPSSEDEQQQIVDFLSAIDDKITLLTKQIESTEQYKKGLLQQMFV